MPDPEDWDNVMTKGNGKKNGSNEGLTPNQFGDKIYSKHDKKLKRAHESLMCHPAVVKTIMDPRLLNDMKAV